MIIQIGLPVCIYSLAWNQHTSSQKDSKAQRRLQPVSTCQILGDVAYKRFHLLLRQVVCPCPSVCLSVTLRYTRDHIGWKSAEIISRLVSPGFALCGPEHHGPEQHPKNLTQGDPSPVDLSVADILMANCDRIFRDSAMITMGSV